MILHIVKCEVCTDQFTFHPMQKWSERDVPDTWITLFQGKDIPGQEGWHFCSKECLAQWALDEEHKS